MALSNSGSQFAGTQVNTIASRDLMIGTPVWNYVVIQKRLRENRLSRLVKKKNQKVQTVDQEQSYTSLAFLNISWVMGPFDNLRGSLFVPVSWKEK